MRAPDAVLVLQIESRRCALSLADVREVVRAAEVAPLPRAPDVVDGLLNLRGELLPVLNLRRRFHAKERDPSPDEHFVIARAGNRTVGLRVDRAEEILQLEEGELDETPAQLPGVGLIAGALKLPDGIILVHDVETFLSQAESLQLDEAMRERRG